MFPKFLRPTSPSLLLLSMGWQNKNKRTKPAIRNTPSWQQIHQTQYASFFYHHEPKKKYCLSEHTMFIPQTSSLVASANYCGLCMYTELNAELYLVPVNTFSHTTKFTSLVWLAKEWYSITHWTSHTTDGTRRNTYCWMHTYAVIMEVWLLPNIQYDCQSAFDQFSKAIQRIPTMIVSDPHTEEMIGIYAKKLFLDEISRHGIVAKGFILTGHLDCMYTTEWKP